MKKKRNLLAALIFLNVIGGGTGQGVLAYEQIISRAPVPGTYDSINRIVTADGPAEGLDIPVTDGGDYTILNGGTISLTTKGSTAYGLWVSEGRNNPTNLTIDGDLKLTIDNSGFTGTNDKVIGVWKYAGYNPFPDAEQPEDQGGVITLHDAAVDVKGAYNAYGLLAGTDFGGNSEGGGHIVVNGNLHVTAHTLKSDSRGTNRTFGIASIMGLVELEGKDNVVTVTADQSTGDNNRETAGLFTTGGGKITSEKDTQLTIAVTNTKTTTGGKTIYGINSGYYDQMDFYKEYQGISGVDLKGTTVITLDTGGYATGVQSAIKAQDHFNDLTIDFLQDDKYQDKRVGIEAETGASVTVDSLHIGTGTDKVRDPSHITALKTSIDKDLYDHSYTNAGTITVNQDKNKEVQLRGQLYAANKGTINVSLSDAASYLYGNTKIQDWGDTVGYLNLDVMNGAKWINVQDINDSASALTTLTLSSGGMVDLTDTRYNGESRYQDIYIKDTFDGSEGTIHMDINAAAHTDNSDRVYVDGIHSGTHYITLNNIDTTGVYDAAGTVLVSVKDEQGEFKANDSEGTLYWNKYTLDRLDKENDETVTEGYGTDWVLAEVDHTDEPTTSVDTILGANALNYHTWIMESDKLMKRMGDLRHNGADDQGLWFRVRGSKISRDDSAFFENEYTTYELGYDNLDKETEDYKRYNGVAISYSDGSSSYKRGSGENSSKAISVYSTTMRNKGHYLDFVFKIMDMNNDFSVFDTNGNNIAGSMDNQGLSVNVEYGRKKALGDKWYIEPQGQLTLGYLDGDDYKLNNGILVDQGGISSLVGRIGFNLGRDIDEKTNFYFKANLLHEFLGDYSLNMMDEATGETLRKEGSFKDTWGEIGIGAAIRTGENSHIYFDMEKTFGGDFTKDWAWNAGVRWTF